MARYSDSEIRRLMRGDWPSEPTMGDFRAVCRELLDARKALRPFAALEPYLICASPSVRVKCDVRAVDIIRAKNALPPRGARVRGAKKDGRKQR
jgi:hypothetical protein